MRKVAGFMWSSSAPPEYDHNRPLENIRRVCCIPFARCYHESIYASLSPSRKGSHITHQSIMFNDEQLKVYSAAIGDIIIRCAVEIEAISKELYTRSGGEKKHLHFDTDCLQRPLICGVSTIRGSILLTPICISVQENLSYTLCVMLTSGAIVPASGK